MKIKSVSWKNFQAYGNKLHTLDFEQNGDGMFYMLVGENGAGKSTLSDVLKFGLYGKTGGGAKEKKSPKDLANRFNNNLYVKICLKASNGADAVIERWVAPNKIALTVNGIPYDQAGKKNIDEYIENELIGIPFYVFDNTISLSANDFTSFLTMSPAEKKQIIDKIFGLDLINAAKSLVKEEIKNIKASADVHERELASIERTIESASRELESLKEKIAEKDESKIASINESIKTYSENIEKIDVKLNEIEEKLPAVSEKSDEIKSKIIEHKNKILAAEKKKELYDNNKCPMCGSDLTTDFHQDVLRDLLSEIAESKDVVNSLVESGKKYADLKKKMDDAKYTCMTKKQSFISEISAYKRELESLQNNTSNDGIESINKIIEENTKNQTEVKKKRSSDDTMLNFYKVVEDIFSDSGIKKAMLSQIIPGINKELAHNLEVMNMNFKIKFDNEFDAKVKQFRFDVKPSTLSLGEHKKINIAVLLAVLKVMKMKLPELNVIFLDEVFSSIDMNGMGQILTIVKNMTKNLQMSSFVVNHSPLPTEIFDYTIRVYKENNYSQLEVTKL